MLQHQAAQEGASCLSHKVSLKIVLISPGKKCDKGISIHHDILHTNVCMNHGKSLISPVMKFSYTDEGMCLSQSQAFSWPTRSAPPLTGVEMAVGSSGVH
jgi:hypothetical protein